MEKFFNTAGPCVPGEHYMVPSGTRCADLHPLVREKRFFVIHAPRQTGKTTLIRDFVEKLNEEGRYLALYCTLETAEGIANVEKGMSVILRVIEKAIRFSAYTPKKMDLVDVHDPNAALNSTLTTYCALLDKPLVIMFDEVDCLAGDTLISFLRQLRQGYVERSNIPFVHALALVGMRNIRDYKAMVRNGRETLGSASPFNIVTEALTIRNFTLEESMQLYSQHSGATGQVFSEEVVAKLFYYTGGQPWLCNAIAREIIVKLLNRDTTKEITVHLVEDAVENIILRRDTHIDSLLERLKEARVRRVLEPVIVGRRTNLDFTNDDLRFTLDLGLLVTNKGDLRPANPIYGEVIIRMLSLNSQYHLPNELEGRHIQDGKLDVTALLKEFQQFWRENSDIWVEKYEYKEAAPHLILQAFLQRVVNSGGRIQREYSAGRGRIDLCIGLGENRYPIELKIRYDARTREDGIRQLAGYMGRVAGKEGWLIIFERDPELDWDRKITWEEIGHEGKKIHVVGC